MVVSISILHTESKDHGDVTDLDLSQKFYHLWKSLLQLVWNVHIERIETILVGVQDE